MDEDDLNWFINGNDDVDDDDDVDEDDYYFRRYILGDHMYDSDEDYLYGDMHNHWNNWDIYGVRDSDYSDYSSNDSEYLEHAMHDFNYSMPDVKVLEHAILRLVQLPRNEPTYESLWEVLSYVKDINQAWAKRAETPYSTETAMKKITKDDIREVFGGAINSDDEDEEAEEAFLNDLEETQSDHDLWKSSVPLKVYNQSIEFMKITGGVDIQNWQMWCTDLITDTLQKSFPRQLPFPVWQVILKNLTLLPRKELQTRIGLLCKTEEDREIEKEWLSQAIAKTVQIAKLMLNIMFGNKVLADNLSCTVIEADRDLLFTSLTRLAKLIAYNDGEAIANDNFNPAINYLWQNSAVPAIDAFDKVFSINLTFLSSPWQAPSSHFGAWFSQSSSTSVGLGMMDCYVFLVDPFRSECSFSIKVTENSSVPKLYLQQDYLIGVLKHSPEANDPLGSDTYLVKIWDTNKSKEEAVPSTLNLSCLERDSPTSAASGVKLHLKRVLAIAVNRIKTCLKLIVTLEYESNKGLKCLTHVINVKNRSEEEVFEDWKLIATHRNFLFLSNDVKLQVYDMNNQYNVLTEIGWDTEKPWKIAFDSDPTSNTFVLWKGDMFQLRTLDEKLSFVNEVKVPIMSGCKQICVNNKLLFVKEGNEEDDLAVGSCMRYLRRLTQSFQEFRYLVDMGSGEKYYIEDKIEQHDKSSMTIFANKKVMKLTYLEPSSSYFEYNSDSDEFEGMLKVMTLDLNLTFEGMLKVESMRAKQTITENNRKKEEAKKRADEAEKRLAEIRATQQKLEKERQEQAANKQKKKREKRQNASAKLRIAVADETVFEGKINSWKYHQSFGFVKVQYEGKKHTVFVHLSNIKDRRDRIVKKGSKLRFNLAWDAGRANPKAINATLVDAPNLAAQPNQAAHEQQPSTSRQD